MKAAIITEQGKPVSPNVKVVTDWPTPESPPAGWATIRTLATALNHLDLWVGMGVPGLKLTYPRISGCDTCGVVETVGDGVDESWIGKTVIMNAAIPAATPPLPGEPPRSSLAPMYELIGEHHNGAQAAQFNAPVAHLQSLPDDVDPIHAAAFGLAFLTAYSMLASKAQLKPGQTVLVTGIGGGVAFASLAIAKHFGCKVVVSSRHQWKLDKAQELGADFGVLDDGSDWWKQVSNWTGRRGVDVAVDSSGKATHRNALCSLAPGGKYVTPGCTSGPDATTDLARVFWNQLSILGSTMGTNEEFAEVVALFRSGALTPVIDSVYTSDNAADAYARLESSEQFGKVVVDWRA